MPTVGGFSNPQLSEIDLDDDGFLDLFVFDRGHHTWRTFLYNTSTGEYDYAPEYERQFPALSDFALLRDYNCDGHADIFTYHDGGFKAYRNTGSNPPEFELFKTKVRSLYGSFDLPAYTLPGDIPAIVDVDGDGDLDILGFGTVNSENTIEYHQNRSMEEYGHCDSLEFVVATQCWGNVEEPPNSSSLDAISCKGIVPPLGSNGSRQHPGSTVLLIDTDGDNDKDLILGDIQTDHLLFGLNVGNAQSATIDTDQITLDFPNATDPASMQYLVSGFEIDADHNGTRDLVLSVNNRIDSSCNTGHLWLYNNSQTSGADYTLQTKTFLVGDMLDLGSGAVPVQMDVNGDGRQDLLIAMDYERTPTAGERSRLYYFRHSGSINAPQFTLEDDDFADWSIFGFQGAYPALGDMDDDGDLDMIIGVADGRLHYFRNDPQGGLANFTPVEFNYQSINTIGSNAAPELADLNGDGMLDLVVGERTGILSYFENTGSAAAASFASTPTISELGNIDISLLCCSGHAAPRVVKNPAFGSGSYLFIGSTEKQIKIYELPANLNAPFAQLDSIVMNSGRITPLITDLDQDGTFDLVIGTGDGGIKYFERAENYPVGTEPPPSAAITAQLKMSLFPNPADQSMAVHTNQVTQGQATLYDLSGRVISRFSFLGEKHTISVGQLQTGSYILRLHTKTGVATERFIVIHP